MNAQATSYALHFRQWAALELAPAATAAEVSQKLRNLLAYVRQHDCALDPEIKDGAIWATCVWSDKFNVAHETRERVGATLNECRIWLGY